MNAKNILRMMQQVALLLEFCLKHEFLIGKLNVENSRR